MEPSFTGFTIIEKLLGVVFIPLLVAFTVNERVVDELTLFGSPDIVPFPEFKVKPAFDKTDAVSP